MADNSIFLKLLSFIVISSLLIYFSSLAYALEHKTLPSYNQVDFINDERDLSIHYFLEAGNLTEDYIKKVIQNCSVKYGDGGIPFIKC